MEKSDAPLVLQEAARALDNIAKFKDLLKPGFEFLIEPFRQRATPGHVHLLRALGLRKETRRAQYARNASFKLKILVIFEFDSAKQSYVCQRADVCQ